MIHRSHKSHKIEQSQYQTNFNLIQYNFGVDFSVLLPIVKNIFKTSVWFCHFFGHFPWISFYDLLENNDNLTFFIDDDGVIDFISKGIPSNRFNKMDTFIRRTYTSMNAN